MTSREISEKYCPDLESWQHDGNERWIEQMRRILIPGGIWFFPGWPGRPVRKHFKKVDDGWEEVLDGGYVEADIFGRAD